MYTNKAENCLVSMFPVNTVGRWIFLFKRKHQIMKDTGLGPAKDPPILKLA